MNTRGRSKSGEDEDEYGSLMSKFEYGAESLREGVKAIRGYPAKARPG